MVNLWSIFIHDSDMIVGHPLEQIINGPAHHTLHHMYFVYNYGQYFTWADKVGGSYRHPQTEDDPLNTILEAEEAKKRYKQEKQEMRLLDEKEKFDALKEKNLTTSSTKLISTTTIMTHQQIPLERRGSECNTEFSSSSASSSGRNSPSYSRSDSGFEDTNSDKESKELPLLRRRK